MIFRALGTMTKGACKLDSKRFARYGALLNRASVVDCGSPLPPFHSTLSRFSRRGNFPERLVEIDSDRHGAQECLGLRTNGDSKVKVDLLTPIDRQQLY